VVQHCQWQCSVQWLSELHWWQADRHCPALHCRYCSSLHWWLTQTNVYMCRNVLLVKDIQSTKQNVCVYWSYVFGKLSFEGMLANLQSENAVIVVLDSVTGKQSSLTLILRSENLARLFRSPSWYQRTLFFCLWRSQLRSNHLDSIIRSCTNSSDSYWGQRVIPLHDEPWSGHWRLPHTSHFPCTHCMFLKLSLCS